MDLTYDKLSDEAITTELATLVHWHIEGGALVKGFQFSEYSHGALFVAAVAHLAEQLNHHPDMLLGYKRVTVSMRTHDAGGGLTSFDFELARRIDAIWREP